MTLPVTVILPVLNEEQNLPEALETSRFAQEVVVVDSGSTDATVAIAEAAGARVVSFHYEGTGPKKKAWTLSTVSVETPWILLLDADERITPPLRAEIEEAVHDGSAAGYYIDRELVFMGRRMRSFQPNWNMRLFRSGRGTIEDLGLGDVPGTGDNEIHEHVVVNGPVGYLASPLLHNDYRGLSAWLDRHNKYATWEAHLYHRFRDEPVGVGPLALFRLDPFQRKRALRRIWVRLPGRPLIRFFVWYVLRRGFRDGREGLAFCLLMAWYEYIIGIKMRELARREVPV